MDVGHLYVVHGELQVFADEAAIAAAFELDGSAQGLSRARDVSAAGPLAGAKRNRWNFGTATVTGVNTQFAAAAAGPFEENPGSAAGRRFVRVRTSASVPLYFLPVISGLAPARTVSAVAVAGQVPSSALGNGLV